MGFLETIWADSFYRGLAAVPIVIFCVTPRAPQWVKSGRILFLWLTTASIAGISLYETLSDKEIMERWGILREGYEYHIFLSLWECLLANTYIGWWEFLWRCIYRQWSWPIKNNLQYGIISNLCIAGSLLLTTVLASLALYLWVYLNFFFER